MVRQWRTAFSRLETSDHGPETSEAELLQSGFRYALALTHHREEAEDLVQETWLNLCRRYGRVENRAVLFTAVRNLYIDQCRRRKLVHFDSLDATEIPEVPDIPVDEPCVKGELAAMLGRLKPTEREVIFLHYYQGHTAEEISRLNGQSRGTVLSLIHRTIAKLRKISESPDEAVSSNQFPLLFVVLVTMTRFLRS
jgi:RNA polymerase sigma-70 factor (ECF subfamily)